jgi:hypothetical protein
MILFFNFKLSFKSLCILLFKHNINYPDIYKYQINKLSISIVLMFKYNLRKLKI